MPFPLILRVHLKNRKKGKKHVQGFFFFISWFIFKQFFFSNHYIESIWTASEIVIKFIWIYWIVWVCLMAVFLCRIVKKKNKNKWKIIFFPFSFIIFFVLWKMVVDLIYINIYIKTTVLHSFCFILFFIKYYNDCDLVDSEKDFNTRWIAWCKYEKKIIINIREGVWLCVIVCVYVTFKVFVVVVVVTSISLQRQKSSWLNTVNGD